MFSRGSALCIEAVHGVIHSEVLFSVRKVVETNLNTPILGIVSPESHAKQKEITRKFKIISMSDFDN